jgi:hypothetical protein
MGQPTNLLLGGQAGLLGADPELYRQQLLQQEQARVAAMPAQNQLAGTLGGLLGRGLSNVSQDRGFFEVTNPVLQKLTSIQNVYNRAMQDSDPNDPLSFYKNLQTGFANAGLGQQALMAGQEYRKAEELGLKTEVAKTDLYKKNPALLDTQIEKARNAGNDPLANQLAQQRGQIQVQIDMDRAKEAAQLALLGAQTDAQKASAARQLADIEGGKTDWKVINDASGQPVAYAILDKKTRNITYEKIGGGEYIPPPPKKEAGETPKGEKRDTSWFQQFQQGQTPAAGVSAQPSMTDRVMSSAQQLLNLPGSALGAIAPANYTRENRDAAILRINPNINLNAISEADKQIIAQKLGL